MVSSPEATCDLNSLWGLLSVRLAPLPGMCSAGKVGGESWGNLLFDSSGQIVDDTGFCCTGPSGPDKQTWLAEIADQRWPCLAGQTVPYVCSSGG
jgi:hypothetical protein